MKWLFKNELYIAIVAFLLFIPFLGWVHLFDWDEINFAESAREMIVTHDYFSVQINFERFWQKPPLFFWMQVLSMKAFGVNEFAARFPNAVCGIATLITIFRAGKKIFDKDLGRIWVMVYIGSIFTFLYFKSGIIDPWFNLFIFLSFYNFYFLTIDESNNRKRHVFLIGLFLGLAVLTKGPVALIIFLLSYFVWISTNRFKLFVRPVEVALIILVFTGVSSFWFGADLIKNGPQFLIKFLQYQVKLFSTEDAGHGGPFFYHWYVLLIGCFPASIFFLRGMFVKTQSGSQKKFKRLMLIVFWVTLILFSIVKTKIVHYSSLCWFPLTFLAAICIYELWKTGKELHPSLKILLGIIGSLFSLLIIAIPLIMLNKYLWIDKVKDVFARENLHAQVNWSWIDGIGSMILLSGVIFYLMSKKFPRKTFVLFASVAACCFITTILIVPKIEAFSQRANIEFFQARQGEDCYVETAGYKSYAQYFYTMKQPFANQNSRDVEWLMHGPIDKPAYISTKIQNRSRIDTIPGMMFLYSKNGFVFYKRNAVIK